MSRIPRSISSLLAALASASLLAGCGGGGASSSTVSALPAPGSAPQSVPVTFSFTIPRSTSTRRPAYVSPATQSVSVAYVPSGGTASAPVSANCTTSCSVTIGAAIGSDTFVVKLYSGVNASGSLLATGTVVKTVVAGVANTFTITTDGVVASLAIAVGGASVGTAGTPAVTVSALDAAGKTIVAPGGYVDANGNPLAISLADSDSTYTSLSATSVTAPGTAVSLNYNGGDLITATLTASATGMTPATAIFAPTPNALGISPSTLALLGTGAGNALTATLSETAYTGTFTESDTCAGVATVTTPSALGPTETYTVTAGAAGSCTATFTDAYGQHATLNIGVTTTGISVQTAPH